MQQSVLQEQQQLGHHLQAQQQEQQQQQLQVQEQQQQQQQEHEQPDQQHSQGRSLKQTSYAGYDPYAGGVTPGLINVDVNAVTGTHLDAAGVAIDISADQNYIGFSLGNIFGVGIARDRGYDIQIGGGNLADISVTKDAGIGLWLLNGLVNLNYMPVGGWSLGTMAAQGTISEAVAAGNATLANIVVNVPGSSISAPIPVIEVNGTTSSQVSTYYNDYGQVAVTGGSSSSSYTAPSSSTYNTYSSPPSSSSSSSSSTFDSSSYLVSRDATDCSEDYSNLWSVESAYSDTAAMSAANAAAGGVYSALTSGGSSSSSTNASIRRACEGGTVVAVSGSKFTCRYKRSSLVRIASDVVTYSNGVVA
uniref:Uncharacterized protein n=1 Tax=Tetradesmus obliquus TaxID=3088 RepID=A0A383VGU5_TETOB|eukprot:jgi/Sobl393_1/14899/SZX68559.1